MLGPDRYVPRLAQIPHSDLEARGFRGLIVDLDNTMLGFAQSEVEEDHLNWVREAKSRGFKLVMVSNNFTGRVTTVAGQLGIECVPNALKPLPFATMRALRMLGLPRAQVAVIGDQLFTDVLSGKMCGLYTILTEPIESKDFALTKVFRFFERLLIPQRPK